MKRLKDIGEFGLIERIRKRLRPCPGCIKGIGDDAAVLVSKREEFMLLTTDSLVEGVHFKKGDNPKAIGRKAISVSISDIAAMGGEPQYCTTSIGAPGDMSLNKIDNIFSGILQRAKEFKVAIVGGDTVRSKNLIINTALIGKVERKSLVTRDGARVNDIIFLSGRVGGSSCLKRHLNFRPHLEESRFLVKNFRINSMIDLSDGLFSDLCKLCKESNVGAVIYEELIPFNKDVNLTSALYEGEDFKLLFTVAPDMAKKVSAIYDYRFFPIGHIQDKRFGLKLVGKGPNREEVSLADKSFKHFR
ncbi:MAG: thiamine-phosphate kinase [Candidatus Omnitrophica bacterium]|nr:thiamine-phosphate kinase [Candidatus Omnitrophota bacterium]